MSARDGDDDERASGEFDPVVQETLVLTGGLVVVVPALTTIMRSVGLSVTRAALVAVGVVGGLYGLRLVRGSVIPGVIAALVVSATFAANIPLTADAGTYPGTLGPSLWLFHGPLAVIALWLALSEGRTLLSRLTLVEGGLGALIVWSLLPVFTGRAVDPWTALWFSAFWFLNAAVAFWTVRTACRRGVTDLRAVAVSLAIAVVGHSTWGLIQVLNGNSMRLFALGEGRRVWATPVVSLGSLGTLPIGAFVSGFAGGSLGLAALSVLVLPILVSLTIIEADWQRWLAVAAAVVAALALRATDKLAAMASLAVGVAVVLVGVAWVRQSSRGSWLVSVRSSGVGAAVAAVTVALMAIPSRRPEYDQGQNGSAGESPGLMPVEAGSAQVQSVPWIAPDGGNPSAIPSWLPGSLTADSALGIRLQQYIAAVDIWTHLPFVGIGGGNFRNYAFVYRIPVPPGHDGPLSLHSLYLALLTETGLPGLLAFTVAVLAVLWYAVIPFRTAANETENCQTTIDPVLVVGVIAGLTAALAVGFWDVVQHQITVIAPFWLLAGALVGSVRRQVDR